MFGWFGYAFRKLRKTNKKKELLKAQYQQWKWRSFPALSVCVCVFSSHSFWTSSALGVPAGATQEEGHTGGRSHRISHPPSFCGACLNFLARRIQPFLSLVDREVEFWAFLFLFFSFLVRKIPFAGIELTSQRVRGLRGSTSDLPGRPGSLWSRFH